MIYRIDRNDRLVFAHGASPRFAAFVGVPDLRPESIGKSLWPHFEDDELRAVFVALVARARTGRAVKLRMRAESPERDSAVTMELSSVRDGGVEFRCTFEAARPPESLRGSCCDLLLLCAWCSRGHCSGDWRDIEDVVADEHLLEHPELPVVTHGICDACLAETAVELDAPAPAEPRSDGRPAAARAVPGTLRRISRSAEGRAAR